MTGTFRIVATEHIPDAALDALREELAGVLPVAETGRIYMRSAEPPTWIQLVASAGDWLPLKAAATVFAAQLAKNAADDAWKNKRAIAAALRDRATGPLVTASLALVRFGSKIPRPMQLMLGIDFPTPHFGSMFHPAADSAEEIAACLAALALKASAIEALMRQHEERGTGPFAGVELALLDSGAIAVQWMDDHGKVHQETVS